MIAIDWGTSSLRAFRLGADGTILDRREAGRGILTVPAGGFADVLRDVAGAWIAAGERRVLLSGMVGSRQGWVEAPYLPCPADPEALAAHLVRVPFDSADVRLAPGLSDRDESGVPEVMRGEEVQLLGVGLTDGIACLPGSHSKWARLAGGRIAGFTTHFSGEAFAAFRGHTILGRMMQADAPPDATAFARGVARAGQPGGLLHHLFGVRALGLHGELGEAEAASYLSGLLIGTEVRAAMPPGAAVTLIGTPTLCAAYAAAILACGGTSTLADPDAAAHGLHLIAEATSWTA
jgi:2-dehydro-3-deoxygalactonokinase